MGKDKETKKKKYEKPKITRHKLDFDEVVLAKCKTGTVGFTGPTGVKCKKGNTPCMTIGAS